MEIIVNDLLIPIEKDSVEEYLKASSEKLQTNTKNIHFIKILGKKLDISDRNQFFYKISIAVSISNISDLDNCILTYPKEPELKVRQAKTLKNKPIIIGFGPAGMFLALELIEYGIKPIIFERGKNIEDRRIDIRDFINKRVLNTESNIQFGEGGAGTYSDGKLFSRINNNPYGNKVLNTFVKFGAPEEILYAARPHLGTDILSKITVQIRNYILEKGGKIHFSSKLTDIIVSGNKASGIIANNDKEYYSDYIYLAPGHSARDTYSILYKKGITFEQKPLSVGIRIEHLAKTINLMRYGKKYADNKITGHANFSFNYTDKENKRSAATFCMCPGGEVVNASSEDGMLVLNGMSYSKRDSDFSNAGIVVTCSTDDYNSVHPLAGIEFQRSIEKKAFEASGRFWHAPAQILTDFLSNKASSILRESSFKMGVMPCDINNILPGFIADTLKNAFNKWKTEEPLFVSDEALILAPETRTSSPVRILRNEKYESVSVKNIYPVGEGAGYAGGIVSSCIDAIKAVEGSLK